MSIDCTYKLITVKHFPVIVPGVTDIRGKFLCIGLSVLRRETAEAFKWVLENIIEKFEKNDINLFRQEIITDADPSILSAIESLSPNFKQLNCYVHIKRHLNAKLVHLSIDQVDSIEEDLHDLQLSMTQFLFQNTINAFFQKWSEFDLSLFLDYFEKQYIKKNNQCFEGPGLFAPSTSNGIERFNLEIKNNYCSIRR